MATICWGCNYVIKSYSFSWLNFMTSALHIRCFLYINESTWFWFCSLKLFCRDWWYIWCTACWWLSNFDLLLCETFPSVKVVALLLTKSIIDIRRFRSSRQCEINRWWLLWWSTGSLLIVCRGRGICGRMDECDSSYLLSVLFFIITYTYF